MRRIRLGRPLLTRASLLCYDYELWKDTNQVINAGYSGEWERQEKGRGVKEKGRNQ